MKNKPNAYRVYYLVMEGDNYAGGWVNRFADVIALGEVERYSNIESVVPIFIECGEALSDEEIQNAIDTVRENRREEGKRQAVLNAEIALAAAKSNI
jgi:hypothetical protein